MKISKIVIFLIVFLFTKPMFALKCELNEYDFGIVKEGEKIKHEFKVQNDTNKVASIKRIISECACMSSSKKIIHLEPNETTPIDITFNTNGYGGRKVKKSILLIDGSGAKLELTIRGVVEGIPLEERLNIMPMEVSMFGDLGEKKEIIIEAPVKKNVKIEVEAPSWINYKLKKQENSPRGMFDIYTLQCSLGKSLIARTSASIYVITDLPHFEKIPIRILIEPKPALVVSPPALFIKNKELGRTCARKFEISVWNDLLKKDAEKDGLKVSQDIVQDRFSPLQLNSPDEEGLPFLIKPSDNCLEVKLLSISRDSNKIECEVTISDCPSKKLYLEIIAGDMRIKNIPIIID